jgi:hypothetical protein
MAFGDCECVPDFSKSDDDGVAINHMSFIPHFHPICETYYVESRGASDQAHANQQWAVADALGKQQRRWLENIKRPRGILDQVHPTEPDSAQQTDQN